MRPINIIKCIILYALLSSSSCHKEGDDCHYNVSVKNSSTTSVIYAKKYVWGSDNSKCVLGGHVLRTNEIYVEHMIDCWEHIFLPGDTFEIFIVDTAKYNIPDVFYSCDSIEIKNNVLKHYFLTIDDLKKSDFTITYP
jgi:hypothetical protein